MVLCTLQSGESYAGVQDLLAKTWTDARPLQDETCPGCGRPSVTQAVSCQTLPGVLVVHLKRAGFVRGKECKLQVSVPIEGEVDLRPHLARPREEPAGDGAGAAAGDVGSPATPGGAAPDSAEEPGNRGDAEAADPADTSAAAAPPQRPPGSTRYRARAVVCHEGEEASGGHYTCWVRTAAGAGRDGWTHYDDSAVHHPQPTLPPEVNSSAYLVFYERRPDAEAEGEAGPGGQR